MKYGFFQKYVILFIVFSVLLLQMCCQEQLEGANASEPAVTESRPALAEDQPQNPTVTMAAVSQKQEPAVSKTTSKVNKSGPDITFDSLIHDFGEVGSVTRNPCEFKFSNTGNALLKISKVHAPCGCTVAKLAKKEYAPGESGVLDVLYRSSSGSGQSTKHIYVYSNDKAKPKVTLSLKAKVVMKVIHEPERLNLFIKGENAGCPAITLTSRDNRPFSIKSFRSTGDAITADFDPSVKAEKFVLKPKLDMEKLQKALRGQVAIELTHPQCKKISIVSDALAEFKVDPRVIYIRDAKPQKPVTRQVRIFSNYNEDVEVESASSKKGFVKVISDEKIRNGYQCELQITPPAAASKSRVFTDVFTVKLKGGQELRITCYGHFSTKNTRSSK
jgi:hypothetical protein